MNNFTATTTAMTPGGMQIQCDGENMIVTPTKHENLNTTEPGIEFGGVTTAINTIFSISESTDAISAEQGIPPREVPNLILYSIVLFLAVVGNALVIITLVANRRMRTVTSCFLLSLSMSDLLLAIICMPISLTGRILKKFVFGRIMCKIMPFFMGASVCISTFTMLAISVERYYAICRPFRSRSWQTVSHAYKVIVGIWVVSCLLSLPYLFLSDLHYIPLIDFGRCSLACRLNFPSAQATRAWYVFLLVILFCIPGALMTVAYILVSCKIWKEFHVKYKGFKGDSVPEEDNDTSDGLYISPKRSGKSFRKIRNSVRKLVTREVSNGDNCVGAREKSEKTTQSSLTVPTHEQSGLSPRQSIKYYNDQEAGTSDKHRKLGRMESHSFSPADRLNAKKKVVRMLIVIVILFFVCWTPLFIVNVWKAFDPLSAMEKLDGIIEIIQLMSYVSTCVNPLVYCFMNQRFRTGFLHAVLFCIPRFRRRPTGRRY